jgi:DNA helicase HerA-like ATPase
MGPLLLSRLLDLNDIQRRSNVVFRVADEQGMLLLDLKDLRAMLAHVAEAAATYKQTYGNVAPASVGAIQRQLLVLETQGGANFFGEPALDIMDFLRVDRDGRGVINILAADRLSRAPRLTTFLLDAFRVSKPSGSQHSTSQLVFFFDERISFTDLRRCLRIERS